MFQLSEFWNNGPKELHFAPGIPQWNGKADSRCRPEDDLASQDGSDTWCKAPHAETELRQ